MEDERIVALDEELILKRYGLEVVSVASGEEAVATMAMRDDIDLILMDINLGPGIDGTEAAELILDRHEVPLIFLSSHTEREIVERTEGITSYGYIVKNSGETVLVASIKMAFRLFEATANERVHEKALRIERDHAKRYLDVAGVMIVALDTECRIVMVNRRVCETLGYHRDELVGKDWFDLCAPGAITPEDREAWAEVMIGRRNLIPRGENEVVTTTGERRLISWQHTVVCDENGIIVGTLSSGEDISERRRHEQAAARNNELAKLLSRIAASFIDRPVEDLDANSREALADVGRFLGLDVSAVAIRRGGTVVVENASPGRETAARPDSYELKAYPWLSSPFTTGRPLFWRLGDEVPAVAGEADRALLSDLGAACFALLPVSVDGEVVACLGFSSRTDSALFDGEVASALELMAQVFAGAIARRRAFDRLKAGQECLSDIAENAPGFVYQFKLDPQGRRSFPFVGGGVQRQYGLSPADLLADPGALAKQVPQESRAEFRSRLAESQGALSRFEMTHRLVGPDGEVRWIEVRATPRRLSDGATLWNGIALDISDRKRAEDASAEEARFARAIGDSVPAMAYLYDGTLRRNVWSNRRHREFFASATGKEPSELEFEDIAALVHPDDFLRLLAEDGRLAADPDATQYQVEVRLRHGEEWRWMLLIVTVFARDSGGGVLQVLGAFFDIAGRKEAELALERSNERLERMVGERDVLLREVNHRVKNNLLMVHSLLNLHESAFDVDLSDVKSQVASIGVVHELLHGANDLTRVDAPEFVDRILRAAFSPEVELEVEVEPSYLSADIAVPFGLLVNELATNAAKHAFVGSVEKRFVLRLTENDGEYSLIAANTGLPFPDDIEPETATTLGLRLVSALVAQLGGSLKLRRSPRTDVRVHFRPADS